MADEALFQFLHNEVIQYIYKSAEGGETVRHWLADLSSVCGPCAVTSCLTSWPLWQENGRNITKLENMGFRVGQGLIERWLLGLVPVLSCVVVYYEHGSFKMFILYTNIFAILCANETTILTIPPSNSMGRHHEFLPVWCYRTGLHSQIGNSDFPHKLAKLVFFTTWCKISYESFGSAAQFGLHTILQEVVKP